MSTASGQLPVRTCRGENQSTSSGIEFVYLQIRVNDSEGPKLVPFSWQVVAGSFPCALTIFTISKTT
jgi:hypothetical protein